MLTRLQRNTLNSREHHEDSAVNAAAPLAHRRQHAGNLAGGGAQVNVLTDSTGQPLNESDLVEALGNEITELAFALAHPFSSGLPLQISKKLIKTIHRHIVPSVTQRGHRKDFIRTYSNILALSDGSCILVSDDHKGVNMKPTEIHVGASALHLLICTAALTAGPSFADRALNADIGAAVVITALCAAVLAGLRLQLSLLLIAVARAFDLIGLPGAVALATWARRIAPAALKASAASMTAVVLAAGTAHAAPDHNSPAQAEPVPQTVGVDTPPPHWPTSPPGDTPYPEPSTGPPADPSWPTQEPDPVPPRTQTKESKRHEPQSERSKQGVHGKDAEDTAPKTESPQRVTVNKGDSIWKIAIAHPKPGQSTAERAAAISQANADILNGNPDLIYPDTELELP